MTLIGSRRDLFPEEMQWADSSAPAPVRSAKSVPVARYAMNVVFDHERLLQLITSLYTLTGIHANIFDLNGKAICLISHRAPFCAQINASPEGHARCEHCDAQAVSRCAGADRFRFYRCHAGICEAILPICVDGMPMAYLICGQFLDSAPLEDQWENTARTLDWYPGGAPALRASFAQFRQYSGTEIDAYTEILEALAEYIQLKGMILTTERSNLQKLEYYLDQHYMEKLSLATISEHLRIGRTKLCALAKELSGGRTLSHLIAERRVRAAKVLLLQSNAPISVIAEQVGVSDYNYFSKLFRSVTGTTPSAFRKAGRSPSSLDGSQL